MDEAETLFYNCCERINQDMEVAEPFLIGCITYVIRERGDRGIRKAIQYDLSMNHYLPYLRELRFLSVMRDDALKALIASSIDLSHILKEITIIYEHTKGVDYDLVSPTTHANKAKRACEMLKELSDNLKPTTKIRTDSSLFVGNE